MGVTLSVGNRKQEGLSLSLSPRWGDPVTGTGTLWQAQGYRGYRPATGRATWGLDAHTEYGVRQRSGRLLTWFTAFSQSPQGPAFAVGVRFGMLGDP